MKNKKLLYILIPGTLALWGMILYKIFSGVSSNDDAEQFQKITLVNTNEKILTDTFSINPNYRDPFLGKINKTFAASDENVSLKKVSPKPISIENTFPNIIYGGLIKNQKSNKQLILVLINGQSNIMKIGDIVNEVELTKIFRDSIEVKFKKEKKFILK